MLEILTLLTYKSAQHIIGDGGSESWKISQRRARRCAFVVCVRHQHGPYKAEGNEPHKHAFLVGKVSNIAQSGEDKDRFRVEISEYAIFDGPEIPLKSASPTQYFPSLSSIKIDAASLHWRPIGELPDGKGESLLGQAAALEYTMRHGDDDDDVPAVSVIMKAKKLVAEGLNVPLSSVEITVRV
jgi:hypothetical protein